MKMLFRVGNIGNIEQRIGIDKVRFLDAGTDVLSAFPKSLWHVMGILGRYDISLYRKINDKDVFYLYDKKTDQQLIIDELDNIILNNNIDNIVNYEDVMIKEAIEGTDLNKAMGLDSFHEAKVEETIYWDALNHFVLIIGKDELKRFAIALEEERYKNYLSAFKGRDGERDIKSFINEGTMVAPTKKMIALAGQRS